MRQTLWNRRFSVSWAILLSILAATVALAQVTEEVALLVIDQWVLDLVLPLFVIFIAIVLTALSLRKWSTVWGVLGIVIIATAATAPSVLAVLSPTFGLPIWFFLAALLFWMVVGIVAVSSSSHSSWMQFLLWLGAASTIAAVVCEFGLRSPIHFADRALREAYALSVLLDIRITLSVVFLTLCLVTSVVRAFGRPAPEIPRVPMGQFGKVAESHTVLAPLMNPPILAVNAALFVLISLFNVVVGLVVTLVLRALYAGTEFGKLLWDLLFEGEAAIRLLKALLATAVVFGVVIVAVQVAPDLRHYLRTSRATLGALLPVLALAIVVLVSAALMALVIDGRYTILSRILFGASLLAVILVMGGGLVYAAASTGFIHVSGFGSIGLVSLVASVLVICGAVAVTVTNIVERKHADQSP